MRTVFNVIISALMKECNTQMPLSSKCEVSSSSHFHFLYSILSDVVLSVVCHQLSYKWKTFSTPLFCCVFKMIKLYLHNKSILLSIISCTKNFFLLLLIISLFCFLFSYVDLCVTLTHG